MAATSVDCAVHGRADDMPGSAGGDRGWVGDNPFIFLDCSKIRKLGWLPRKTIRESVRLTVRYLVANPRVLEAGKDKA